MTESETSTSEIDDCSTAPPIRRDTLAGDGLNLFRGFCMGAADTVPGVSGGTVALILGHYDRLIEAISHVDTEAAAMLGGRRWRDLAAKLDLRFTLALAIGIVVGIGSLAGLMHHLLLHQMNETMSVFFGLVVASIWVVRRNVTHWTGGRWIGLAVGIAVALAISKIPASSSEVNLAYLFASASVAICAMILPGISGAFVLLLLGVYEPVVGMVKQFFKLNIDGAIITKLTVFAIGCGIGLLAFSRLLNYLLHHHRDITMATLIGLMIGSVRRLWPLQSVTPETADLELKFHEYVLVSPAQYHGSFVQLLTLAVIAAAVVLLADRVTQMAVPETQLGSDPRGNRFH